jgi:hypothetical protein
MRLLRRHAGPRARTARPAAEPYLAAGAELARRLGHNYVGTEHVLSVLIHDPEGPAARLLAELGVGPDAVEGALACWLVDGTTTARIDPHALAELGIDFEAVRERLEQTFGYRPLSVALVAGALVALDPYSVPLLPAFLSYWTSVSLGSLPTPPRRRRAACAGDRYTKERSYILLAWRSIWSTSTKMPCALLALSSARRRSRKPSIAPCAKRAAPTARG